MGFLDRFKTKQRRTSEEINKLMVGTFETELGQRLLTHLAEVFIDRDIYKQGMTIEETAFRQGEASIIKKIIMEVERNGRSTVTDDSE